MKLPLSTRIARRTLRTLPAPRFAASYEPGLRRMRTGPWPRIRLRS